MVQVKEVCRQSIVVEELRHRVLPPKQQQPVNPIIVHHSLHAHYEQENFQPHKGCELNFDVSWHPMKQIESCAALKLSQLVRRSKITDRIMRLCDLRGA